MLVEMQSLFVLACVRFEAIAFNLWRVIEQIVGFGPFIRTIQLKCNRSYRDAFKFYSINWNKHDNSNWNQISIQSICNYIENAYAAYKQCRHFNWILNHRQSKQAWAYVINKVSPFLSPRKKKRKKKCMVSCSRRLKSSITIRFIGSVLIFNDPFAKWKASCFCLEST